MGQKRIEHTASIAVAGADGQRYTVDEFTSFTAFRPISGPQQWHKGARSYSVDGEDCNRIDNDTFQVVLTDQILRRV